MLFRGIFVYWCILGRAYFGKVALLRPPRGHMLNYQNRFLGRSSPNLKIKERKIGTLHQCTNIPPIKEWLYNSADGSND
jgi:hypothetical protein